jgi:hypothetical protein
MSMELPQSFYVPAERERQRGTWIVWVAIVAALISGWHVFALPGSLVHLYRMPEDMPSFGFGLAGVTIRPEGEWVIRRLHYADRMGRYTILPDGELVRQKDHGAELERDRSGSFLSSRVYMTNGHTLKISASSSTTRIIRNQREQALASKGVELPAAGFTAKRAEIGAVLEPPSVFITVFSAQQAQRFSVLKGRHYYEMIDAACFRSPYIWITTGKLDQLHRISASDTGTDDPATPDRDESIEVVELNSVELDIPAQSNDTSLGKDPHSGRLYIVTASGDRYWFDPETLEQTGRDRLPGHWEPEYAVLAATRSRSDYPAYGDDVGVPLTRAGYERLMRGLMLVFLASLTVLAVRWRKPWKYISEATTAASPSSSRSTTT